VGTAFFAGGAPGRGRACHGGLVSDDLSARGNVLANDVEGGNESDGAAPTLESAVCGLQRWLGRRFGGSCSQNKIKLLLSQIIFRYLSRVQ
jgi:hypothetical protein